MFRNMICVGGVVLVGCTGPAPTPETPQPAMPEKDTCKAVQVAEFIGRPSTSLEKKLLLQPVRIIRPGDAVTEDFLPTRINFFLDSEGTIQRITCG